jgi:4-hydroxythreonine-4-phosphate dehydrogenase
MRPAANEHGGVAPSAMKIAITCGDPAGVGPEIVERWAASAEAIGDRWVVLGPARWVERLAAQRQGAGPAPLAVGDPDFIAEPGRPTDAGARLAWTAMEEAAAGCRDGRWDAVVTGPVSKSALQRVGYPFPGQSEFFADRWGGEPSMAFTGGRLRVVLATWHIPLADVARSVTREAVERAVARADWLARAEGCAAPRLAVCGLNPHAGEDGMLGREEVDSIDPWLRELAGRFPGLGRSLPGDTVFARMLRGEFDAIVALYHDQGLAPLKAVDFDRSVNVTLGLPFVRTSPDHGTAFGIAGRGVAEISSFASAVRVAERLACHQRAMARNRPV